MDKKKPIVTPEIKRQLARTREEMAAGNSVSLEELQAQAGDRPRLGQTAQVFVTTAAAETYAAEYRIGVEEARRELTSQLALAVRPESDVERQRPGQPEMWRRRNRSLGLDISARVVRETPERGAPLAVVVAVNPRDWIASRRESERP